MSIKAKGALALAVMALLGVVAQAASAATATVTGSVTPGSLSIATSATPSFSATLDGTDQSKTYTVATTVADARGSGAGWNLTITSTQFTTGGGTPSLLPTNASTLTGVTNACSSGSTCVSPTNTTTYPVAVPAGSSPPTAVKYFNAGTTTGRGKFDNTPSVNVAVPATTDAGSYSSTLTLAAVTGP